MRFCHPKDPEVSLVLMPWFIPSDKTHLEIGWELHEKLRKSPDDTFCFVAVKNCTIQAVLIAYVRKEKNDIFIWQARAKAGFRYSKIVFAGLVKWAQERGFHKLRAGMDKKRQRCFKRLYGFVPVNGEIERNI